MALGERTHYSQHSNDTVDLNPIYWQHELQVSGSCRMKVDGDRSARDTLVPRTLSERVQRWAIEQPGRRTSRIRASRA